MVVELLCGGLLVVGAVGAVFLIGIYNKLVKLNERVDNAWAQIDVQLKRRYDLIPNLVETVKGIVKQERKVFTEVTKLRTSIVNGTPAQRAEADNLLTAALGKLFAVAENYPELKSNTNFVKLQEQLEGTEDKISFVRTAYNDAVTEFNVQIKFFPNNLVAGILGFNKEKEYFQTPKEQRKNVKVKFD